MGPMGTHILLGGVVYLLDNLDRLEALKSVRGDNAIAGKHLCDVGVDLLMVRHRTYVMPVLVRWIAGGDFTNLVVSDVLVFQLIQVLAANLDRSLRTENCQGAFHIFGAGIRSKVDAPQRPTGELQNYHTSVFELGHILVLEISGKTLYGRHVPHHPVQQVDEVAELGEEATSIQFERSFPAFLVVVGVAVPEAVQLDGKNLSQYVSVN